jgi:uncharacterized protein YkwD
MKGRWAAGFAIGFMSALIAGAALASWTLFSGDRPSRQSSVAGARIEPPGVGNDDRLTAAITDFRSRRARAETQTAAPTVADVLTFFDALLYGAPAQPEPTVGEALVFFNALLYGPGPTPSQPSVADTLVFFYALLYGGESLASPPAPAAEPPSAAKAPPPPPTATPEPPPAAQTDADVWTESLFTQSVWDGVNARRAQAGLGAVSAEGRLHAAAYNYATLIAERRWFSHTGPDGSSFVDRIVAAGFPFTVEVGEVLAMGSQGWPADEVVGAWMDSAPHREQLLNPAYTRAGLECAFTHENGALMVRCVMEFATG